MSNAQVLMNVPARFSSTIPLQDVYCDGNYHTSSVNEGASADRSRLCTRVPANPLSQIPTGVIDWVLVELRTATSGDANNATTVIARKPAFLLQNGRVVDAEAYTGNCTASTVSGDDNTDDAVTGTGNCPDVVFDQASFDDLIGDDQLYLAIRHRNHIDIISDEMLSENDGKYVYDFSDRGDRTFDGGTKELTISGETIHVMRSGDAASGLGGLVSTADYFDGVQPFPNQPGYSRGDTNLNGLVEGATEFFSKIQPNSGQRPTAILR